MADLSYSRSRQQSDDDRIMPLINVVFLLLIFFMIAGQLAATDPFDITPPEADSGGDPDPVPKLILIGRDGQLALDGVVLDEAELVQRFADSGLATIRLKADGGVAAARVIALMERLRDAGLRDMQLLTLPQTE